MQTISVGKLSGDDDNVAVYFLFLLSLHLGGKPAYLKNLPRLTPWGRQKKLSEMSQLTCPAKHCWLDLSTNPNASTTSKPSKLAGDIKGAVKSVAGPLSKL